MSKLTLTQCIVIGLTTLYFLNEGYQCLRWRNLSEWQMRGDGLLWLTIILLTMLWEKVLDFLRL